MFVFHVHGSLEADISQKMPFEVSFSCDKISIYCDLIYLQHSPVTKMQFFAHYKSCSFIKSCGKPTITSTTMQERHDKDEIEPHNHNE